MKVLIITHKPPYPATDGSSLAVYNLAAGLKKKNTKVDVLAIETQKHPFDKNDADKVPFNLECHFVDTSIKPLSALNSLIKDESYNISRFYDKNFEKAIIKKLNEKNYDIVQLESLFVTPYINAIRKNSKAKIVYRSHNVEYKIWEHLANGEKKLLKRSYLKKLSKQLKEYEYGTLNKYDGAVFITNIDQEYYRTVGCEKPHITIPFSIDTGKYMGKTVTNKSICYLGSMDWLPNTEGIDWFINNVWQSIESTTDIDFYLAGKNMPKQYFAHTSNQFHVIGGVHSAIDFINNHNIMVVPLFSGSGIRVKIIEAMALGKIVIGTELSFQGIKGIEDGKNAFIAHTATEFYDKIIEIYEDKLMMKKISKNASSLIHENYSVDSTTEQLKDFYKTIIDGA